MTHPPLPSDSSRDPIDDLRELLAIEPDHTFAARVERSTAGQAPGGRLLGMRSGLFSIAALVAVLIVASTYDDFFPVRVQEVRTTALPPPGLDTGASAAPDGRARTAALATTDSDPRETVAALPARRAPATARPVDNELGVIWTQEESIVLEQWVRDVQAHRVKLVPAEPAPGDDEAFSLITIHPLEIAPLTIDTLQMRSPSRGNS